MNMFKRNNNPIETSSIASKIMETLVGIISKVNTWIVFFAKSSAGLQFGKNFKAPNHKYTMPMEIAKKLLFFMLFKILWFSGLLYFSTDNISCYCGKGDYANRT